MSKKASTEEFILKAKLIHVDKYDYSLVDYQGAFTNITLICFSHGIFNKKPTHHLRGQGCVMCLKESKSIKPVLNNSDFIKKAKVIHNNFYDYSKVIYKKNFIKIEIICPEHGSFWQIPYSHLKKYGCKKCGIKIAIKKTSSSTEKFIRKAIICHGDKYDYSQSNYINSSTKLKIICKTHGEFFQIPENHLAKGKPQGCNKCGRDITAACRTPSLKEFINDANIIHLNKYDYSKVNYKTFNSKSIIICKIHGDFYQTPAKHLSGQRCALCSNIEAGLKIRSCSKDFINKSNIVHNNKYDYSKTIYTTCKQKVEIICHKHGIFFQSPNAHLRGQGCVKCSTSISHLETKWLDSLLIPNELRNKSLRIGKRLILTDAYDPITNTIYEFNGDFWHGNPKIYNSNDINNMTKTTFGELYQKTIDRENLIKNTGYNLIVKWESDL